MLLPQIVNVYLIFPYYEQESEGMRVMDEWRGVQGEESPLPLNPSPFGDILHNRMKKSSNG